MQDAAVSLCLYYGVIATIEVYFFGIALPSLLDEYFTKFDDPTAVRQFPFETRLPELSTFFLAHWHDDLRGTRIGKHCLGVLETRNDEYDGAPPPRPCVLSFAPGSAPSPGSLNALRRIYADQTWRPSPAVRLGIFLASSFVLLPPSIQEVLFEEPNLSLVSAFLGADGPATLLVYEQPSAAEGDEPPARQLYLATAESDRFVERGLLVVQLRDEALTEESIAGAVHCAVIRGSPVKTLLATLSQVYLPALADASSWAATLSEEGRHEFSTSLGRFVSTLDGAVSSLEGGVWKASVTVGGHTLAGARRSQRFGNATVYRRVDGADVAAEHFSVNGQPMFPLPLPPTGLGEG